MSQAIDDGLSRQEIAEKYGMHVESISRRMQRLGKYAGGLSKGDPLRGLRQNWGQKTENLKNEKVFGDCWHYIKSQDDLVKKKHPDFWYLETRKKRMRLKCKKCNNVIERASSTVSRKNVCCDYCIEQQKQKEQLQNERIKLMRFFVALKNSKEPRRCECCGAEFCSPYQTQVYCSKKCKRKAQKIRRKERDPEGYALVLKRHKCNGNRHISRAKMYGCDYVYGISLAKVIEKDNNICQICGEPCDKNDRSWGDSGPVYPSIDHIVPLSKGGSHTWDNVQLVHIICNSYKRDLLTVKREEVWT